jgi:glycosyltransferase involved in cell wall biosynthesis
MSKLTVVIPTYNRCKLLKHLLDSLSNQTLSKDRYRIIVVDDCSTDETSNMMKTLINKSKIISYYRLKKNSGSGYARNEGINHVKEGYIVFIDDDCIVYKDTLQKIISFLNKYPFIKCLRCDLDSFKNASLIDRYINYGLSTKYDKDIKKINSDLYLVTNIPTFLAVYHRDVFNLKHNNQKIRFKKLKRRQDVELNHILSKVGIKLYYTPSIRCVHDTNNKRISYIFHRKKRAGITVFIIKTIHPDYPARIPSSFKNTILFFLNIFYKPLSIIRNTELKYLIPFMLFAFIHQIAFNYGIYIAKRMYDKKMDLMTINKLNI